MAFVNEYVSEEDVKKYDLESVWKKVTWDTPLQYVWTVDREQNAFLIAYASGREEFSNQIDFALCWDREIHTARLVKNNDRLNGIENLVTNWRLIGIDCAAGSMHSKEEVLAILKDALSAYKLAGVAIPVKNHTAIFDF